MDESKSLKLLKQLKKDYDNRSVSALVGSGFSKNAITDYMNWDELLEDIVIYLYGEKINESYGHPLTEPGYREHKKKAIQRYIKEVGYLNLVSQYIEAKGYREAIDVFIEDHIPFIKKDGEKYSVTTTTIDDSFTKDNLSVHNELLNCRWKHVFTTNYDNLLELANESFGLDYQIVKTDYQLSDLNGKRGIIKIHGSLVENSLDSDYEFDNDKSRRYIISKEDYDTYTDKHQAFSYYMRTSLLTGVFCLVGFSGNDPNFLGWLDWMRDILDKDINNNKQNTKIYLISINNDDLEKDRVLFYKNHRIGIINIKDPDVLKELSQAASRDVQGTPIESMKDLTTINTYSLNENSSVSELLIQFFKYLRMDSNVKMDGSNVSKYYDLWLRINPSATIDSVNELRMLRSPILPHKKTKLQYNYLYENIDRKEWDVVSSSLFAIAANDCGFVPSCFNSEFEDKMNNLPEWQQMQLIDAAYRNDVFPENTKLDEDTKYYCRILHYLYSFRFDEAYNLINGWMPSNDWVVIKASLLAEYDKSKAIEILEGYLHDSNNNQIKYYATCLINIFLSIHPFRYSYDEYKELHLDSIWDVINEIINNLKKKPQKPIPYGVVNRSFSFSDQISSYKERLKLLALLAKTSFRVQFGSVELINSTDWYHVFSGLYELYPLPCLYYSLQLTDRNTLHRIGQDYAFSEELADKLSLILKRLLGVVLSEALKINVNSYYVLCSELLVAVKEDLWFDQFIIILKNKFIPVANRIYSNDDIAIFVKTATSLLKNHHYVKTVFCELIDCISETNTYLISGIIYNMKLKALQEIPSSQKQIIHNLIESQPVTISYLLVASLYRHELIDDEIKALVCKRIVEDKEKVFATDSNTLYSLSRFTNNCDKSITVIKKSILGRDIWNCGIKDDHSATYPQYLKLNKMSDDIQWSNQEMEIIINNMIDNIHKLKKSPFINDSMLGREYISLAIDMLDFVDNIAIEKYHMTSYEKISEEIRNLLCQLTPFGGTFEIFYDSEQDIRDAVHYLARCIDYYGTDKYTEYINALIYRALMKEKKYLNLVLGFIEFMALNHFDFFENSEGYHKLQLLLEIYSDVDYREIEVQIPAAYRVLRNIAKKLSESGAFSGRIIDYWLNDPKVNRFCFDDTV